MGCTSPPELAEHLNFGRPHVVSAGHTFFQPVPYPTFVQHYLLDRVGYIVDIM